jgi:lipopolysaccharide/colanic/teichoic acid biosynthesis glycosyltransferase
LALFTPRQALRLRVRPGLAGLAQAAGRNAVGWERRLELDAAYAGAPPRCASDLRLLLRCGVLALTGQGAAAPGHATMPVFRGENQS